MSHGRAINAPLNPSHTRFLKSYPIGLDAATITAGPWARWQRDNCSLTVPHLFTWMAREGTEENFALVGPGYDGSAERRGMWFSDSDLYKSIEALAWAGSNEHSAVLDRVVALVAAAQLDDGYINTHVQAGRGERWLNLTTSHELYCIGHLIQAGIALARAMNDRSLLDVAVAAADCIVRDVDSGILAGLDGHEQIEMALIELYRETAHSPYLRVARDFIDRRGQRSIVDLLPFDSLYYQDATPVRDEVTVVGHAVRAMYLLAAVVDLYIETGEGALLAAAISQWDSMVSSKMYLTGAIGARYFGEAFGEPFELPPDVGYGETCASIGAIMAGWRLLLATGDSRFADVIERELFNAFSGSTSPSRTSFFYSNPLQRRRVEPAAADDRKAERADAPGTRPQWFECACCPPNISRTIASLGGYIASQTQSTIFIHQFISSSLTFDLDAGVAAVAIDTKYPSDGYIAVQVTATQATPWTIAMRLPAWADEGQVSIAVNGIDSSVTAVNGYVLTNRSWSVGDKVALHLPVTARFTLAHPDVDALRGTIAVERGPVVYALEGTDLPAGVDIAQIRVDPGASPIESMAEILPGTEDVVIDVQGVAEAIPLTSPAWSTLGELPVPERAQVTLHLIPYALWANRGPSTMRVFLPITRSN